MITEDYVSFELAKLLKEKGFNEKCLMWYYGKNIINSDGNPLKADTLLKAQTNSGTIKNEHTIHACTAPTLQMAMKWLREKHNRNITVKAHNNVARLKTIYYIEVQNLLEPAGMGFCVNGCTFRDTYEEACEAAIKYCLENLI